MSFAKKKGIEICKIVAQLERNCRACWRRVVLLGFFPTL